MKGKVLAVAAVALSALSAAADGELLANPDFEGAIKDGCPAGWLDTGHRKHVAGRGFGRNGGNGLKYVGDGKAREWVYQNVTVEPGEDYLFQGWARTENIRSSRGVGLQVAFYNSQGRCLEGTCSSILTGTTDEWTPLEVRVRPPKETVRAEVSVLVGDGETGTAHFDDLSFRKCRRPPIRFFVADAYRDTATDGAVGFRLVSNLTDAEIAARGLRGSALVPDANGNRRQRTVSVPDPKEGVWSFSLDLTGMPYGELPVAFALDGTNGVRVATATLFVNHVRRLPERRVWIDRRGRAIVDGKPFFPFGMFTDDLAGARAEEYAAGPFNCVLPYATMRREQLDWAERKGLKVICSLKDHHRGAMWQPFPIADEADEQSVVAANVAGLRDHPALLAWYLADEVGPGMIPRLRERDRLFRRLDPDHPTVNCLCRSDIAREYMDTCDVQSGDPYPIRAGKDDPPIAKVAENTRTLAAAYFGWRPLWQIPQAFDWSYVFKEKDKVRVPTGDEILNMSLQCVAEGANGILLWTYHRLGHTALGVRDRDRRWREICELGAVIRGMLPVFLSDDVSGCVSGRRDDLPVRAWRHEGKTWVLAVNASYRPQKTTVTVGGSPLELDLAPLGHFFGPLKHPQE